VKADWVLTFAFVSPVLARGCASGVRKVAIHSAVGPAKRDVTAVIALSGVTLGAVSRIGRLDVCGFVTGVSDIVEADLAVNISGTTGRTLLAPLNNSVE
jgi:hypothetical protein